MAPSDHALLSASGAHRWLNGTSAMEISKTFGRRFVLIRSCTGTSRALVISERGCASLKQQPKECLFFRVADPRQLDALFDALERGAAVFSSWE